MHYSASLCRGTKLFDLSGRVAIVTGASKGLGEAIALGLASAGADLVIVSRKIEEIKHIKDTGAAVAERLTGAVLTNNPGAWQYQELIDLGTVTAITEPVCWHRVKQNNVWGPWYPKEGYVTPSKFGGQPASTMALLA